METYRGRNHTRKNKAVISKYTSLLCNVKIDTLKKLSRQTKKQNKIVKNNRLNYNLGDSVIDTTLNVHTVVILRIIIV